LPDRLPFSATLIPFHCLSVFGCGERGQIFFQLALRNEKEWLLKVAFCVEKEIKHHKKAFIVDERILL
jgi:hypothetical protein